MNAVVPVAAVVRLMRFTIAFASPTRLLVFTVLLLTATTQTMVFAATARLLQPGAISDPASERERFLTDTPDGALIARLRLKASAPATDSPHIHKLVAQCNRCHDAEMHGENSYLPILQGQNLEYLFAKIVFFREHAESFHPMRALTQSLDDDAIIDIALYYASRSSSLDNSLLQAETRSQARRSVNGGIQADCNVCHGIEGNGGALIPDISGQNENYLSYRIREIANNDSRVHLHGLGPVSCQIVDVDLAGSKIMARRFAMVVDPDRVIRGEAIYSHNCSRCHDHGESGAPKLSDKHSWMQRIQQGTRELVRNALLGKQNMPARGGNWQLSRNQLLDAIHFMIHQVGLDRR